MRDRRGKKELKRQSLNKSCAMCQVSITVNVGDQQAKLALTVTRRGAFDNAPVRLLLHGELGFLKTAGQAGIVGGGGGGIRGRERLAAEDRGARGKGNDNSRDYAEMRGVAFVRKREREKNASSEVYIRAAPAACRLKHACLNMRDRVKYFFFSLSPSPSFVSAR